MRLFVAAELPEPVAGALARWRPRDDGLRPVAVEALHVTLAFLGERDEEEVEAIGAVVRGAARPVGSLAVDEALWLPPRRPRVLAVRLADGDGALGALQADVADGLEAATSWRREKRPFLPHVTVARVRHGARAGGELPAVPELGAFAATAVTLFHSRLSPKGAHYEPLARAGLELP